MFSLWGTKKTNQSKHKKTIKKRMNCSPVVAGKTVTTDTCMTVDILQKIKSEYNHTHRDNPIREQDPKKILAEFHDRLSLCSQEDCWLRQIKDEKLRNKIEKYLFAPKHPKEWKYNPNEWLSNYDIFNVLTQWEDAYSSFEFIGPSFIDFDSKPEENNDSCVDRDLCKFSLKDQIRAGRKKIAIVFNLDKHTQSGSHWVSLWIDVEDRFIFFFDSAGAEIPIEIMRLVNRIKKQGLALKKPIKFRFHQNHPMEHQYENTECGMYSLFFIITMLTNHTDDQKFKNYKEKIMFFKKTRIPDKYVENLRWKYFND
jgi:Ulp1 protease family, C-terminal catalytic domain/Vaccinia virus I7 processing peptidase